MFQNICKKSQIQLMEKKSSLAPVWVEHCGLYENGDDKKRLKNHKEGRIFLLAKFLVFLGVFLTLCFCRSFLHFGIPKAIWKIFEMAVY